jgi:hypothetical protein
MGRDANPAHIFLSGVYSLLDPFAFILEKEKDQLK